MISIGSFVGIYRLKNAENGGCGERNKKAAESGGL